MHDGRAGATMGGGALRASAAGESVRAKNAAREGVERPSATVDVQKGDTDARERRDRETRAATPLHAANCRVVVSRPVHGASGK